MGLRSASEPRSPSIEEYTETQAAQGASVRYQLSWCGRSFPPPVLSQPHCLLRLLSEREWPLGLGPAGQVRAGSRCQRLPVLSSHPPPVPAGQGCLLLGSLLSDFLSAALKINWSERVMGLRTTLSLACLRLFCGDLARSQL